MENYQSTWIFNMAVVVNQSSKKNVFNYISQTTQKNNIFLVVINTTAYFPRDWNVNAIEVHRVLCL